MSGTRSGLMALLDQCDSQGSWAQSTPAAAAFGLLAGGATAVVAVPVTAHAPHGPLGTIPLALAYLALVAGASLVVGTWRSAGLRSSGASRLLLAASAWLAPLVLLAEARSVWTLPVAAAFGALAASLFRELATVASPEDLEAEKVFLLLPEPTLDTRRRASAAKAATIAAYAGATTVALGYLGFGVILFALACAVLAWFGTIGSASRANRNIALALAATALALFPESWARFGPYRPPVPEDAEEGTAETRGAGLISGVVLLTDADAEPPLLAPLAPRRPNPAPAKPLTSASIRFTGEYWYFFWPLRRPADDAIRKLGDPITLTYRAVDGSSLVMQARQPLPQPIQLACCRAIDLVLRNREGQPETIYVELVLLNSKGGKAREQSLSGKRLPTHPVQRTTLRFDLPNAADSRVFDEIVVWFHLDESRRSRSANLAIERFDLIR